MDKGVLPTVFLILAFYRMSNPDIRDFDGPLLWHFVTRGHREGRNPHPIFSVDWYLSKYPEFLRSYEPSGALHPDRS